MRMNVTDNYLKVTSITNGHCNKHFLHQRDRNLELVLSNNYFIFESDFLLQIQGVASNYENLHEGQI
jgi:hypothetical protein